MYVPTLAGAEPRLQRRYHQLVVAHLSHSHRLAAGLHPPPSVATPFAAVQAAWRFYSNERVNLPQLCGPMMEWARAEAATACDHRILVPLDWSLLHYCDHESKRDRVMLASARDLGYDLLTALAISDRDGSPIAPLCLELRAGDGTHSTRANEVLPTSSTLDSLGPVMAHVTESGLGKLPVFIIDREADSIGHFRAWDEAGHRFIVRVDDNRLVLHAGQESRLDAVAKSLKDAGHYKRVRTLILRGEEVEQFVAETTVVLHRPAHQHRVEPGTKKRRSRQIPGAPLPLRLVVSELRQATGKVTARWLLLTNLPDSVAASTVTLWYYWRWRIESYHKLLKGAGQQVECWQQETPATLSRRLLVAAMSVVIVWRLARDETPASAEMRDVLIRLSGRQMKRGPRARPFTEPALLAGLGILFTLLDCLTRYSPDDLLRIARQAIPGLLPLTTPTKLDGDG